MSKKTKTDIVLELYYKKNINNFALYKKEFIIQKNITPIKFINIICKRLNNSLLHKNIKIIILKFKNNYFIYKK